MVEKGADLVLDRALRAELAGSQLAELVTAVRQRESGPARWRRADFGRRKDSRDERGARGGAA